MVAIARLHTPPEIVHHLDRFVIAQDAAKRRVAMAVYNHYIGLRHRELKGAGGQDFGRQHLLLLGPTGVGKTLMVKTLGAYLGVPVAFTAATTLVETGYIGAPVESIFLALLERAGGDPRVAEQGIVYLDEFDKLKRARDIGRDVSGEGVQNGLLTLLDGRIVRLRYKESDVALDTSRILFLFTGAFAGLADLVRARLAKRARPALGFNGTGVRRQMLHDDELLAQAVSDDLIAFGFIPELVARFGDIVKLHALTGADLERVLCDLPHSPLAMKRAFFELHGVRVEVDDDARAALVERAQAQGLGARMLHRVVRDAFAPVEYELAGLLGRGFGAVRLTRGAVTGECDAELIPALELPAWEPPSPSAAQLREGSLLRVPRPPSIAEQIRERSQRRQGPPGGLPDRRKAPRSSEDGPTLFDSLP